MLNLSRNINLDNNKKKLYVLNKYIKQIGFLSLRFLVVTCLKPGCPMFQGLPGNA